MGPQTVCAVIDALPPLDGVFPTTPRGVGWSLCLDWSLPGSASESTGRCRGSANHALGLIHVPELRAASACMRSTGPAPPQRLTPQQRRLCKRLIALHGKDTRAMMLDHRANPMQHSEGVLRKMLASFEHWGDDTNVSFRVPVKSLWKV